jgi:hypothetical protein
MKKPLSFSLLFPVFSAGVLRSQSDSPLEKWWNGKRGTGDWLRARPALEDRGINLTGKWIGTFYGVATGGGPTRLAPRNLNDFLISFQLRLSRKREAPNQQSKPTFNPSNKYD